MIALLSYNKTYWINLYDNYPTWFTDTVPRFLVFLDLLAPLIIHTLLLIVPYFWYISIHAGSETFSISLSIRSP